MVTRRNDAKPNTEKELPAGQVGDIVVVVAVVVVVVGVVLVVVAVVVVVVVDVAFVG